MVDAPPLVQPRRDSILDPLPPIFYTSHMADQRPATPGTRRSRKRLGWETMEDADLLKLRICDLGLKLSGSAVETNVKQLYSELTDKGISFHPACYLTTEWLCPDRVPLIGIPFCLAHPRLTKLERTMMLEVEGGTDKSCMQLLRHEMGHAINYAYLLFRRSRWRELFGPISQEYNPSEYYPRPYSRQFVEHLPDNYAQAHPDEDFAETFAVWLTPNLDWRRKYRGRYALKKLEYVDHLMHQIGEQSPKISGGRKLWPVSRVRSTLARYYKNKRAAFGEDFPGYYDPFLNQLFANGTHDEQESACTWLRRNRRSIINQIASNARLRKYQVDVVLKKLIHRSGELELNLKDSEESTLLRLSIALTAMLCEDRVRREFLQSETE